MTGAPRLLRVPERFQTVEDVLHTALQMDLPNVLIISELEDGRLAFLEGPSDCMTVAGVNWLLDRAKAILLSGQEPLPP